MLLIFSCLFVFAVSIAYANPSDLWVFGADMPISADAGENGYCEDYPAVSGNLVVWQQCFEGNEPSRIYFKDLGSLNPEQPLVDVQPFHYNQQKPAVSGNLVVWTEEVVSSSNYPFEGQVIEKELYGLDKQSGDSPRFIAHGTSLGGSMGIGGSAVSGRRIVWSEGNPANPGSSYIFLYDFDTEIKQLVSDGPRDGSPDIDGDWVVWTDFNSDGKETHGFNISTGETFRVTIDGNSYDSSPSISGDLVTFARYSREACCTTGQIWLYKISTGEEWPVTSDDMRGSASPQISGDKIVWESWLWDNNESDIYLHDISSGETQQISSSGLAWSPAVDQDRIFWRDFRDNGSGRIYFNELNEQAGSLVDKYSPYLYLHNDEHFEPRKIDIMIAGDGTRLMRNNIGQKTVEMEGSNLTLDLLGTFSSSSDRPDDEADGKYLDLRGDVRLVASTARDNYGPRLFRDQFLDRYDNLVKSEAYPETMYADVTRDVDTGMVSIQYWLPYYFDNWVNYHEGDWEHVDVMLGRL